MHPSKHLLISSVQNPLPASIVKNILSEVKRGPQMASIHAGHQYQ